MISAGRSSGGGGPTAPRSAGRVIERIVMLGNRDFVARADTLILDADPVHLDAVAALHIADVPVAAVHIERAVVCRDIGEAKDDVAALSSADQELLFEKRDRIATALRNEFTVHCDTLLRSSNFTPELHSAADIRSFRQPQPLTADRVGADRPLRPPPAASYMGCQLHGLPRARIAPTRADPSTGCHGTWAAIKRFVLTRGTTQDWPPCLTSPGQLLLYADRPVSSTNSLPARSLQPSWRTAGLRYHAYNFALRERFGRRVQKVSLDAGFTCPNVDGTVAKGGCTFCDNRSFSPSRRLPRGGAAWTNRPKHRSPAKTLQELPRLSCLFSAGDKHVCTRR